MNDSPTVAGKSELAEYSVVFTERALNHMSSSFQQVMCDISAMLKQVYKAEAVALVPGGGTCGMEAVARQFATGRKCLVLRNGWFSYRWSQIFAAGQIPSAEVVLKARAQSTAVDAAFAPPPIEEVVRTIEREKPELVFAAHVETASGIILPQAYLEELARATRAVGGLLVLDCIASGTAWVDMRASGVDVLLSAPQKGWSSVPSAALVMLSSAATQRLEQTTSSSFALDLRKWRALMAAYEGGAHAYHATLPTDALVNLRDNMRETLDMGLAEARAAQEELGQRVRTLLAEYGFPSVAAEGFAAPGVVVSHTRDEAIHSGSAFAGQGLQIARGVPLACDESDGFKTFRIGLFGLDKLKNIDATVERLQATLDGMGLHSQS